MNRDSAWSARMTRRQPGSPDLLRLLPLVAIVVLLAALVLIPAWVRQRTGRLHDLAIDVIVPARNALLETQLAFASEASAMRGYVLTGDSLFLQRFRAELARERAAAERLSVLARRLGPEVVASVADFRARKDAWREQPLDLLEGRASRDQLMAALLTGQRQLEAALAAADRVNTAVIREEADVRARIGTEERAAWLLVVLLSLAALVVALMVAWLSSRLESLTIRLRYRIAEETSLHRIARTLSGALSVQEVVQLVANEAVASTRAIASFVERLARTGEDAVEVIAAAGEETPAPGARVSYDKSLTARVVGFAEPALGIGTEAIGAALAPYLAPRTDPGTALVVPLATEEGVRGALVLLARSAAGTFGRSESAYARALGDLVTAALRRVLLLEREQQARHEAEAAVRHRDLMLRVVSHDLKNPLHTIGMVAQLLLDTPLTEEARARQLQIVRRTVDRMDRLVRDLLDAARVQSGRGITVAPAPVNVASLVAEAVEPFRILASEKHQRFECDVLDDAGMVMADRSRLLQVFANLIGNAMKFTPEGGHIRVHAEPHADGAVRFAVADTGPGIPADSLPHLFEPFWQATDSATLGTGLGLAITHAIVEAHNGRMTVESTPGEGSTFTFTLPVADMSATGRPA